MEYLSTKEVVQRGDHVSMVRKDADGFYDGADAGG